MTVSEMMEILQKEDPNQEITFIQLQENFWGEYVPCNLLIEDVSKNNEKLQILLGN